MPRRRLRLIALGAVGLALLAAIAPPRRLDAAPPRGVQLKDLTWVETRAARASGFAMVIVPTGATGVAPPGGAADQAKILGARSLEVGALAHQRALAQGNALVAPVFRYGATPAAPAGNTSATTGATTGAPPAPDLGLPAPVLAGVLEGAARSLKAAGFTSIVFMAADAASGETQDRLARRLSQQWAREGVKVISQIASPGTGSPAGSRPGDARVDAARSHAGAGQPPDSAVELAGMTPAALRAAHAAGFSTVIVPTGGLEQNGPHMILGKHDYLVGHAARRIARALGRTLVAPVIPFVPEGETDPPTGHLRFPGTIGVPDNVLAGVLEGAARRLKAAGFTTIVFIGDHGLSQPIQAGVAARLSREWASQGVRVAQIDTYYTAPEQPRTLRQEGYSDAEIGQHAGLVDTSELLAVHPAGVDLTRYRPRSPWLEDTGVDGDPSRADAALGERLIRMRIDTAVREINAVRQAVPGAG